MDNALPVNHKARFMCFYDTQCRFEKIPLEWAGTLKQQKLYSYLFGAGLVTEE